MIPVKLFNNQLKILRVVGLPLQSSHRLVRVVGAGWRSLPLTIDFRARTLSVDGGPAIESFVPAYLDKYQWYFSIVPVPITVCDQCGWNVM